jgi:hypothetical protein
MWPRAGRDPWPTHYRIADTDFLPESTLATLDESVKIQQQKFAGTARAATGEFRLPVSREYLATAR